MAKASEPRAPDDPYERTAQTFPKLTDEQVDRIADYGDLESVKKDSPLFTRGDRGADFFVVRSGEIEVYDRTKDGATNIIATHGPHQFTGELDLFSDRQILVSGRTGQNSELIRVKHHDFRRMMASEPDIGELIMRAFILRRVGLIGHQQGGVTLIGHGNDSENLRLQRFLTRNGYPHQFLDVDDDDMKDEIGDLSARHDLNSDHLPFIIVDQTPIVRPSNGELADALGLTEQVESDRTWDVIIVGGGPSGLASAVYAASEGLSVIVLEAMAPGGQAGTSSKIENYLGFPTGISGQALAGRAQVQAQKFGARLAIARKAMKLSESENIRYAIATDANDHLHGRAVIIATGARYRKPTLERLAHFERHGVHYAATAMEAKLCENTEIGVVGGGNSAGQAAIFMAQHARHVHMLIRSDSLSASMSKYLIERLEASSKITLHYNTVVEELQGQNSLEGVILNNTQSGERMQKPIRQLFLMIGAVPNTDWLNDCVALDDNGFVKTGTCPEGHPLASPYATTRPGIFAVGDVRSGSVKRVANAVGEGSVVIQAVHKSLADID